MSEKILANCSPYFTTSQYIDNLEKKKDRIKGRLISRILNFKKYLSRGLKIIH